MRIVLATCKQWPEPMSDLPLRCKLEDAGHDVLCAPWNGPIEPFHDCDIVILRACWDYYLSPDAFLAWLGELEANAIRVANDLEMVRWNFNKRYLLELIDLGIPTIPTIIIDADPVATHSAMESHGWSEAVRKPLHGQSGNYMDRLSLRQADWPQPQTSAPMILQPFQSDISRLGESLFVFFEGKLSHVIKRNLASGEWRSNAQFGSHRSIDDPKPHIKDQVTELLATICAAKKWENPPLYARVDGILREDEFVLMELELIEPALGFDLAPQAATRFTDCIKRRMQIT